MNVLVFGAQGSGKSTHAKYIAEKLGVPYIYTGDLFRELEKEKSERGRKIRELMRQGIIIPNELSVPALKEHLKKFNISEGVVFDGYPRNREQAEALPIKLDFIVYITLLKKTAIERLLQRGRADDTPESIETRLELYEKSTEPLLSYYKKQGIKVFEVDNTPPIAVVQKKIDDLLKNKRRNKNYA